MSQNNATHSEGNIIHTYPMGSFGRKEVTLHYQAVVKFAEHHKTWALFEHPKANAGLSPEGEIALMTQYQNVVNAGCKVIALEVSTVFAERLNKYIFPEIDCPCMASQDKDALLAFINSNI